MAALFHSIHARKDASKIYIKATLDNSEELTKDEFMVYDILKNFCFFGLLMSLALIGLGKIGFKVARKEKAKFARRMRCKSTKVTIFLVIMGCITTHYAHELGRHIKVIG